MIDRWLTWPALGAVLALLIRDATERSGIWTVVAFGAAGAALGLVVAFVVRR